ncbi:MAG: ComEC family competence protein [Magnetococcus sp. WYHC-3]
MQAFHTIIAGKAHLPSLAEVKERLYAGGDWVLSELAAQRPFLFLWTPVFMGAGIVTYFSLSVEPTQAQFATVAMLTALAASLAAFNIGGVRLPMLLLLCAGMGFCAAKLRTEWVYTPILQKKINVTDVAGTVEMVELFAEGSGVRLLLKDLAIEDLAPENTPLRARIKLRGSPDLRAGDRVRMLAGLNPPSPPVLPGGFDYQRYMYFQKIGAIGFSFGEPELVERPQKGGLFSAIENLRTQITAQLSDTLGAGGAVAAALLVGHRSAIPESDQEAIRDAGLAHMLSISGLHISLFFGMVFFAVRLMMAAVPLLALKHPIKNYAAMAAMGATIFYAAVAGASVPTLRSVLMMGVVFFAILLNRTPLSLRLLVFAAAVILLSAPESLMSASFQMSFAAVAALIAFYEAIRPLSSAWHRKAGVLRRIILYFAGVSLTTIVATVATAPFTLFHFQTFPVYSLLANVLAMPVLAFAVMPLAALYFLLIPFGLEHIAVPALGWGSDVILDIARWVSSISHAVAHGVQWPAAALLWFGVGFVIVILTQGRLRVMALLPMLVSFWIISIQNQSDVLFSSSGKLIAVRQADGVYAYNEGRKEAFTREQWAKATGHEAQDAVVLWPREGRLGDLSCDGLACRLNRDGHKVSFLKDLSAFPEECRWADVIVALDPAPECEGAVVIDKFSALRNGAYAIYLGEPIPVIRSVEEERGWRPWTARAQK